MIKSEILNNLINQALEGKQARSPQNANLSKAVSSKAKLRSLMTANPSNKNKEVKGKNKPNNSISHQKVSLETESKETSSTKVYQSNDIILQEKASEGAKANNKSYQPKAGSFFKSRTSKPKTLQINTNYSLQSNQEIVFEFKPSSAKNSSWLDNYSPHQKNLLLGSENRFNLTDLKLNHPQSVKNSNSRTSDYFLNKVFNPVSCSHKLLAQGPKNTLSTEPNHKSLSLQKGSFLKMISPQRAKPKDERAGTIELLSNNLKLSDKRRNSYRNRRCNQDHEIHDDPTSKLSTKTPSQFSEVRRSFPSQKSRSMIKQDTLDHAEDDSKDVSSCQKSHKNAAIKHKESKFFAMANSKSPSVKDNVHPILTRKAKSNALVSLDLTDMYSRDRTSFSNFLKTFYEQKKSEGAEKLLLKEKKNQKQNTHDNHEEAKISHGREYIREENFDSKQEEKSSVSINNLTCEFSSKIYDPLETSEEKDLEIQLSYRKPVYESRHENKSLHTYSLNDVVHGKEARVADEDFRSPIRTDNIRNSLVEGALSKISSETAKKNNNEEIKINSKAKFLLLRKQVQEKRALRNTRSFEPNKLGKNKGANKERLQNRVIHSSLERDFQTKDNAKCLIEIFKKTKQTLQVYQQKEREWIEERQVLLTKIQNLQYQLGENSKYE